uniref:GDP-D-glucose phosphorylase 1 n=1 Tax=Parascaris univalens TaxID=6257 RepID=A0A915AR03_PARUN
MRKIVMLGSTPRTQRSLSSIQLPVGLECTSSSPVFYYSTTDFIYDLHASRSNSDGNDSRQKLKELLMSRWEAAKKDKVFNYDLNCMYKLLPGDFNFSVQLNVERGQLRRKPMRFHAVREPFSILRWNFNKLNQNEVMMYLRCKDRPISSDPLDRHVIAVNSSPLERGHSLVIPAINRCLPQILTETAVRIATDIMLLIDDESFHILFNSLLGQASVNHLHLHALFWPYDSDLINRKCEHVIDDMYVIRRPNWFISAIIFQLTSHNHFDKFMRNIWKCAEYLSSKEVAHNIFFSRAQPLRTTGEEWSEDRKHELPLLVTAYIFPRVSITGAKPALNFNPAAIELAGCLPAYTYRFFETITEEVALRIIDEEATLPDSLFNQLCTNLEDVLSGKTPPKPKHENSGDSDLTSPELDELRDSFQTFELHSPRRFFIKQKPRANSADSALAFTFPGVDDHQLDGHTKSGGPSSA